MGKMIFVSMVLLLSITGCAHSISEPSRAQVDTTVTFRELRQNPDAYRGKLVMFGGTVAAVERGGEGVRLEVTEHRLDSRELPDETIPSGGRFLATIPESLNPVRCQAGALVVMVGKVVGEKSVQRQGAVASYPVIAVTEIHKIVIPEETRWGAWR